MNIKEYYTLEKCEKIFNAVEKSNWRIWKTKDIDGLCRQNGFIISTAKKLQKFIRECRNPQALYVSVSQFLNPHKNKGFFANRKVETKGGHYFYPTYGYLNADCILLNSYYFIDIDDENLTVVQEDGRKIIRYMENHHVWKKEYKLRYIQFSGTKGIHLLYDYLNSSQTKDPTARIRNEIDDKDDLTVDLLKNLDLKTIDKTHRSIMNNVFAVYAAPFSIKNSGRIVMPIDKYDFLINDIYNILSLKLARTKGKTVSEVESPDDKKVARVEEQSSAPQLYLAGERASLSSLPIKFRFVDNMVDGLKNNYVTAIKKHKSRFNIRRLKDLQKLYNLSDFYIYSLGNYIYAYNFKLSDFPRQAKILRRIKSENLSFFMTRGHAPMPISEIRYMDESIGDDINHVGILKSNFGLEHGHSRPHCNLFKVNYKNMSGRESNRVGTMMVS